MPWFPACCCARVFRYVSHHHIALDNNMYIRDLCLFRPGALRCLDLITGAGWVALAPRFQLCVRCACPCRARTVGAVLPCLWLGPWWHMVRCDVRVCGVLV